MKSPLVLLVIVFLVMMVPMFLMSNRQKKAQRAQQELVAQLGIGDEVRTQSGFYGIIVEQDENVVILETESGAQTKWARAAIAGKADPAPGPGAAGPAAGGQEPQARPGAADDVTPSSSGDFDASTGETSNGRDDFLGGARPEDTDHR